MTSSPACPPSQPPEASESMTLARAYDRCTRLACSHYENFPVGRLAPARLRPHVHAVYAFARTADDIADEGYLDPRQAPADRGAAPGESERLQLMAKFSGRLEDCIANRIPHDDTRWIFLPLRDTMERFDLPPQLFRDLLSAFTQDIVKRRYADRAEVLDYCRRSANPIGRLVLLLHGYRDDGLMRMSDAVCSALQLANFWQDVSVDLGKDRIYLPEQDRTRHGVSEEDLFAGRATPGFLSLMREVTGWSRELFAQGRDLPRHLRSGLRWEIRLTWLGGTRILEKIADQGYDTLARRPRLTWVDALQLLPYAWFTR